MPFKKTVSLAKAEAVLHRLVKNPSMDTAFNSKIDITMSHAQVQKLAVALFMAGYKQATEDVVDVLDEALDNIEDADYVPDEPRVEVSYAVRPV